MEIDKKYYNINFETGMKKELWKKYDEQFSKLVLEYIDENKYSKLQCLDKPDLQMPDKSLGIEVASVVSEAEGAIAGNFLNYIDESVNPNKKIKSKQYLVNACCNIAFQGVMNWPSKSNKDEENNLINVYSKKISKLRSYKEQGFDKIGIFLVNYNPTIRYNINDFANVLKTKFPEKDYDSIFYCSANKILVLDADKNILLSTVINKSDYQALSIMARCNIENNETTNKL